ncbi:MAG: phosphatase PAP2 family protein [bacterium]|nr:phosphatase PAP2 family protein [bacterium]
MDAAITIALNAFALRSPAWSALSVFLASGLLWVLIGFGAMVVTRLPAASRLSQVWFIAASVVISYGCSQLIGWLAFRARPFVTHPAVTQLIARDAADKSFPSDHATIAFAFALPLLAATPSLWMRMVLVVLMVLIALGRVLVGVHYVSDVAAGALLAAGVWMLLRWVRSSMA